MNIEDIRGICMAFPNVSQGVKWGNDLVFSVGSKMFCVVGLDQVPATASFKVTDEEFEMMSARPFFKPAPYLARYKWVFIEDISRMKKSEWQRVLRQSYDLVRSKLPAKIRKQLDNQG